MDLYNFSFYLCTSNWLQMDHRKFTELLKLDGKLFFVRFGICEVQMQNSSFAKPFVMKAWFTACAVTCNILANLACYAFKEQRVLWIDVCINYTHIRLLQCRSRAPLKLLNMRKTIWTYCTGRKEHVWSITFDLNRCWT